MEFRAASAAGGDWEALVAACIDGLGDRPAGCNLGFFYLSDVVANDFEQVRRQLRTLTGIDAWVGTIGIAVCANGVEHWNVPALSLMVGSFDNDTFRPFTCTDEGLAELAGLAEWQARENCAFALVHGDPRRREVPDAVAALSDWMGSGFLVGGLGSSRGAYGQVAGAHAGGALCGVLFSERVPVVTRLSQGCIPIGPRRTVTAAEQNVLIQLDGRPALDVFKDDIGEVLSRDLQHVGGFIFVGLSIPASDTGDYLVRNILGLDPDQGLIAIADAPAVGSTLRFCKRDVESARTDLCRMLKGISHSLSGQPPSGGVYTSCLARGANLFGAPSEELQLIREVLGDFPLTGYFANGEISHNRLYTYTGVLAVFP